jgi:hypothetical protein
MHSIKQAALAGLASFALAAPAHAYIDIVFDYRYDTTGYFTDDKRAVLEQVELAFESRIFSDLTAVISDPAGDGLIASPFSSLADIRNFSVGQGQFYIFVNSSASATAKEGHNVFGRQGGFSYTRGIRGSAEFKDNHLYRGQEVDTRYGGALTFSSALDYYVDEDISTVESFAGQYDFYTAALKGMLDIFGVNLTTDARGRYNGEHLKSQNNGLPVNSQVNGGKRTVGGVMGSLADGSLQEAVFAFGLATGERRYLTELDYALMDDAGWDVSGFTEMPNTPPVPEPQTWAMLAAGLGLIGLQARKKMRG